MTFAIINQEVFDMTKRLPIMSPSIHSDWTELLRQTTDIDVIFEWLMNHVPSHNFPENFEMDVNEVFDEEQIVNFIGKLLTSSNTDDIDLCESIVEKVSEKMKPENVFDKKVLESWAIENGFKKVKED